MNFSKALLLIAPPAILFSNQFLEDARKLYELKELIDLDKFSHLNESA
ncbi:hypothetical protein [Flagellimonas marinaquae]